MEALIYFVFWAFAFFVMMRLGCGAHVLGHGDSSEKPSDQSQNSQLRWIPPEKDRDPVCNKMISTTSAKSSVHDGTVYYFCSRECREQFEAAPNLYLGNTSSQTAFDELEKEKEKSHA